MACVITPITSEFSGGTIDIDTSCESSRFSSYTPYYSKLYELTVRQPTAQEESWYPDGDIRIKTRMYVYSSASEVSLYLTNIDDIDTPVAPIIEKYNDEELVIHLPPNCVFGVEIVVENGSYPVSVDFNMYDDGAVDCLNLGPYDNPNPGPYDDPNGCDLPSCDLPAVIDPIDCTTVYQACPTATYALCDTVCFDDELPAGTVLSADCASPRNELRYSNNYQFTLVEATRVIFTYTTDGTYTPFMYLVDGTDLVNGDLLSACEIVSYDCTLEAILPAGVYSMILTSDFDAETGTYSLTKVCYPSGAGTFKFDTAVNMLTLSNNTLDSTYLFDSKINLASEIWRAYLDLMDSGMLIDDQTSYVVNKLSLLTSGFTIETDLSSHSEQLATLIAGFELQTFIWESKNNSVEAGFTIGAELNSKLEAIHQMMSEVKIDPKLTYGISLILDSAVSIGAETSIKAEMVTLFESCLMIGAIKLLDEEYVCYALNTESKGVTEYTNFDFNSYSYPLAANKNGIYQLDEGVDFDGTPIEAGIKTGLMDFGSSLEKQITYAYFGITSDNRILVKTVTNHRGIKQEVWYEVDSHNVALNTTRAKLSHAVKSRYWQFEMTNLDGEPMGLESMELIPLVLKRRI